VATVLEAEWNTKLRELEEARAIEEQHNQSDQHQVSEEERTEMDGVPERFRPFWENPKTTVRQRKRAIRSSRRSCACKTKNHLPPKPEGC